MKRTIGGDRIGSGNKMKVDLHNYNRSTHDLGYVFRSTMAAGTLVPFMVEVALPGDTFDINLNCDIKTHPTIGPLFGSYKVQLDVFEAPLRLYNSYLHNNKLGIGLKMSDIKLPLLGITTYANPNFPGNVLAANDQIDTSCLLQYLGIRGGGLNTDSVNHIREFNAIPLLAYWDIYKNYYANKQEEIGQVLHGPTPAAMSGAMISVETELALIPQSPTIGSIICRENFTAANASSPINMDQIILHTTIGDYTLRQVTSYWVEDAAGPFTLYAALDKAKFPELTIINWSVAPVPINTTPQVTSFPLENIDKMRELILTSAGNVPFSVNDANLTPYEWVVGQNASGVNFCQNSQEGLGLKTYQSDLFNNWMATEWIDGPGGISEITAVDTSSGSFNIDTLNMAKKVYDMLNRIAISGGSYDDWIDTVYQENKYGKCESPIYHGGLIKELVFQEVVSNASASDESVQPLGTLAGKGVLAKKHKGGQIHIKVNEPSYIMGIISLTPRIDYSQGNKWDVNLKTLDDFHKPALDEIGFQELITEQLAWWDTTWVTGVTPGWTTKSAGKQPAWVNYMTNVNRTYGNFAKIDNEMFMTLNRLYEYNTASMNINDLTTYIDPAKYNRIFAQTSLDSQNFWTQIAVDIEARRLLSAKLMPNL